MKTATRFAALAALAAAATALAAAATALAALPSTPASAANHAKRTTTTTITRSVHVAFENCNAQHITLAVTAPTRRRRRSPSECSSATPAAPHVAPRRPCTSPRRTTP